MKVLFLISALSLLLFAFALTHGFAADLAIYSGPTNRGWVSQAAAIANAQAIMNDARIKTIFENIENHGNGDEVGYDSPLGRWMQAHTGNGQQDVFIAASGNAPSAIYQFPNVDPDGSNIENFIEDGNVYINVGDYILFSSHEGGRQNPWNAEAGARNVFDISWIHFWPPGGHGVPSISMFPTEAGKRYIPSLKTFGSDRPWHLQQFLGTDWEVTAFAVAKDDPHSADPAVAVNKIYGGIIAAMWQKAQPNWIGNDPRGIGVIEFVANWLTEHGNITTPVNTQGNPATTWDKIKPTNDGTDTVPEVENKVHLVYFLPRDRTAQPDIDTKLNALIKSTQQFYANQMQSYGYGNKTFALETDANGKAVVHHLNGQFTTAYYQDQTYNKVHGEVSKQFNSTKHVYLVAADVSSESLGITNQTTLCGVTGGTWRSHDNQLWWKDLGGVTVIPAAGGCFNPQTTGHELGHAFGLGHDFRDDTYLMGYGIGSRLSHCAAEWLSVHPFLNANLTGFNRNTTIETRSRRDGRFLFQVTDADGLHQARLLIPTTVGDPNRRPGTKLHSCKALNGKTSSAVEFVASVLAETSGQEVTLKVIDVHGNITKKSFPIHPSSVDKITGPWLWVIAPTATRQGGAASINIDSLAAASGGKVTEADVALNGAITGNAVGNYVWTLGEIAASELNNINVLLNKIGMVNGGNPATTADDVDINNHSSYALITLESATEQSDVEMFVGSDDAIKVWLNGEVVHNNPVDRPASDFQDKFKVNLKVGDNLLMVKVSELFGSWSMFVGVDADVIVKQPSDDTVGKTTTSKPNTDANRTTTVSISPSLVQSPTMGQQLTLSLYITGGAAVAGYQATVKFDTAVLRYVSSTKGDYLSEGAFFVPPAVSGNTVRLAATTFSGESNGDGTLATLTFEVVAVQPSTLILSEVILSDNNSQLSYPDVENGEVVMPAHVIGDVNGDGVVNIQDLVKVASSFGQTGQTDADVNGDGMVNIADLVKVASIIGTGAAAPSALPQAFEMFTAAEVQYWLTQAQHLDLTDPTSQRGILVLKQLLAVLMPKETALLPNYPNPFNPETWIPYHLASPSVVQITIYNARGAIVHQMDLGHQREGYYTSRNRAAYWDGMNDVGESVASGIYFYQLRTDKASLLRKMVILK